MSETMGQSEIRAWLEVSSLRIENAELKEQLVAVGAERMKLDKLVSDVERCYRMLLSEPNTKGALFKAENILREALVDAKGPNDV